MTYRELSLCIATPIALALLLTACAPVNPMMPHELRYFRSDQCSHALAVALPEATKGNATGQFNMGQMWETGCGVPRNYINAYDWYVLAAHQGNTNAMRALGNMQLRGAIAAPDVNQAADWFALAARLGDVSAQTNLVALGRPVPPIDVVRTSDTRRSSWLSDFAQVFALSALLYYGESGRPAVQSGFQTSCVLDSVRDTLLVNCR